MLILLVLCAAGCATSYTRFKIDSTAAATERSAAQIRQDWQSAIHNVIQPDSTEAGNIWPLIARRRVRLTMISGEQVEGRIVSAEDELVIVTSGSLSNETVDVAWGNLKFVEISGRKMRPLEQATAIVLVPLVVLFGIAVGWSLFGRPGLS